MFKALLKTSRKSWLSHRHTYSWTYSLWSGASIPRPPNLPSIALVSCPDPYSPAVHRSHNLYVSCLLILLKHFPHQRSLDLSVSFFHFHWALNFSQSEFPPLSQSHVGIALHLWNEDGYDSLPPVLLRLKGIHIILTGGMKDRNWKNQVANENMTQMMAYFQSCADQHLFQFKYRRGRRDVYK